MDRAEIADCCFHDTKLKHNSLKRKMVTYCAKICPEGYIWVLKNNEVDHPQIALKHLGLWLPLKLKQIRMNISLSLALLFYTLNVIPLAFWLRTVFWWGVGRNLGNCCSRKIFSCANRSLTGGTRYAWFMSTNNSLWTCNVNITMQICLQSYREPHYFKSKLTLQ